MSFAWLHCWSGAQSLFVYWSFHPSQAFTVSGVLFFNHIQLMSFFYTFAMSPYALHRIENIHNGNLYIKKYYIFYLFSQSSHKLHRSQNWGLINFWALCLFILDRMDGQVTNSGSLYRLIWTSEWMSEPYEKRNISKVYLCPTSTIKLSRMCWSGDYWASQMCWKNSKFPLYTRGFHLINTIK